MITVALASLASALVVICFVAVCGWTLTWRRHVARRRVNARLSGLGARPVPRRGRRPRLAQPREARLERPLETQLETLQRRFVSGEITLDQYERDIDRLPHSPTRA